MDLSGLRRRDAAAHSRRLVYSGRLFGGPHSHASRINKQATVSADSAPELAIQSPELDGFEYVI